jgi:hypothetical protein
MATKKISELASKGANLQDTDLFEISEYDGVSDYVSKSITGENIKAEIRNLLFYNDFASFPLTGSTGYLYVDKDTEAVYLWTGVAYSQVNSGSNFANADLTFDNNRNHDLAGYKATLDNAELKIIADGNDPSDVPFEVTQANGTDSILKVLGNCSVTSRGKGDLSGNTAYGLNAGISFTSGNNNTLYGAYSGSNELSTGVSNVFVGINSGLNNNGNYNIMIGNGAGQNATSNNNVFIGYSTGYTSTGNNNVGIGYQSFFDLTSGTYNTGLGFYAGAGITTGEGNVIIGTQEAQPADLDNSVVIGRGAVATADNQFVVGSSTYNAGAVATEAFTQALTWTVKINGVDYKIPLQLA